MTLCFKKLMKTRILFLLLIASLQIEAQNLVPNAGFEKCNEIPNWWTGTFSKFNRWMKDWSSPTQGSPDILFTELKDKMNPQRPGFDLRPHFPRSGKLMLGIKTYGCARGTLHCKEYLQVRLKEALIPGDEYYVEFFVNPLQHSILVNNIGVGFTDKRQNRIYDEGLYDIKPVVHEIKITRSAPNEWKKVSGTFTAEKAYKYLIIGNFFKDRKTWADTSNARIKYSFLLLDDVLLKNISGRQTNPQNREIEVGDIIQLSDINFDHNEAVLLPSSFDILNELVGILEEKPTFGLEIAGHTDSVGEDQFNLDLSKRRAKAVFSFFVEKGIDASRLSFQGFGEGVPIADNKTIEGRQLNRRVEMKILEK